MMVIEFENQAGDVLYQNTKEEGDGYGYENGYDYLQSFVCIDEVSHLQGSCAIYRFHDSQSKCAA